MVGIYEACRFGMLSMKYLLLLVLSVSVFHVCLIQAQLIGQVLVNGVYTYNDPSLQLHYKFDADNHGQNSGGLLLMKKNYQMQSMDLNMDNSLANTNEIKKGTASHMLGTNRAFTTGGREFYGYSTDFTISLWLYISREGYSNWDTNQQTVFWF